MGSPSNQAQSDGQLPTNSESYGSLLRPLFWLAALLVSAFLTWSARHGITVDGLSYLDIGDAYWRRDWAHAINSYWSPLYSWILGLGLGVIKPSTYWEFPAIQLINFLISVAVLWCFDFFWQQQRQLLSKEFSKSTVEPGEAMPRWAWETVGYTLFIWTIAQATIVSSVTPDLLVAGVIFLAAGILTRMRAGRTGFTMFGLLGLVLAVGYLAKGAMLVLSVTFLAVSFFTVSDRWKATARVFVTCIVFVIVAAPFVTVLSLSKGRLTIGDNSRINYAWGLNRTAPFFHWQGGVPAGGTPLHPTRKLLSAPAFYEFAEPIGGTYPPHYDPSYWNAGLKPYFNVKHQARALITSGYSFYESILLPQSGLIVGATVLLFLSGNALIVFLRIGQRWDLWFPGCAALGMYALVTLEPRYVGAFVILIWAVVLSAVRLPDSMKSKRILLPVTIAVALTLCLSVVEKIGTRIYEWKDRSTPGNWQVAEGLRHLGVREGDRIVSLGSAYNAYWAHLARLKIIGEIPTSDLESFWAGGAQVQSEVYATSSRIGAVAIIASDFPKSAPHSSWQRIGETDFYVYLLSPTDPRTYNQ